VAQDKNIYLQSTVTVIVCVGPSPYKSLNGVQLYVTRFTDLSLTKVVYTAVLLPAVALNKLCCSLRNRCLAGGLACELQVSVKLSFRTTVKLGVVNFVFMGRYSAKDDV